jgi:hypothetical protein
VAEPMPTPLAGLKMFGTSNATKLTAIFMLGVELRFEF